jgi:hypothetical protein
LADNVEIRNDIAPAVIFRMPVGSLRLLNKAMGAVENHLIYKLK